MRKEGVYSMHSILLMVLHIYHLSNITTSTPLNLCPVVYSKLITNTRHYSAKYHSL